VEALQRYLGGDSFLYCEGLGIRRELQIDGHLLLAEETLLLLVAFVGNKLGCSLVQLAEDAFLEVLLKKDFTL
jgi:hypothetical protein